MEFDELEWLRDIIDAWLSENGVLLGLGLSLVLAIATYLGTH